MNKCRAILFILSDNRHTVEELNNHLKTLDGQHVVSAQVLYNSQGEATIFVVFYETNDNNSFSQD